MDVDQITTVVYDRRTIVVRRRSRRTGSQLTSCGVFSSAVRCLAIVQSAGNLN